MSVLLNGVYILSHFGAKVKPYFLLLVPLHFQRLRLRRSGLFGFLAALG
jgi:hypothetical protein